MTRPRRRHRRRPAPARGRPAHRVHAAGPGQEPLPRAQRLRQRRLHGAALRPVGRRSARRASSELLEATGLGPFADRPAGKLSGGMKQKVGPVRRAGPRSGSAHPRRADHRRRSALAAAVLDAHRRHPRRPPRHERRHLHRLHGRGAAVGLDRRDGRRARAGDGHAGGADGSARARRISSSASSRCCPRRSAAGHTELVIPPRAAGTTEIAIEAHGLTQPLRRPSPPSITSRCRSSAARSSASSARTAAASRRR